MKSIHIIIILLLCGLTACSQDEDGQKTKERESPKHQKEEKAVLHKYGGWYCPDNLRGFPAVNPSDWATVPVIRNKLPNKEEVEKGESLILIDTIKYPDAKALNMNLPAMAEIYNMSTNRKEKVILIQAVIIETDTIVGYRFLNGGNGSARLREVNIIDPVSNDDFGKYIIQSVTINAKPNKVWEILTNNVYAQDLGATVSLIPSAMWRDKTNVNYHYVNAGEPTGKFAELLYGLYYIQNAYCCEGFTEKFILFNNEEDKYTTIEIVVGPFKDDYDTNNYRLKNWLKEVKKRSEKI